MSLEEHEEALYLTTAAKMQQFGLDSIIQEQVSSCVPRSYVHAELLVHEYYRLHRDKHQIKKFWNDWKYIGSNKPTCRLCQHYINATPEQVSVSNSHRKLYLDCQLPTIFENHGSANVSLANFTILSQVTESVRNDLKRALDKCLSTRKNELKTHFTWPLHYRSGANDPANLNDAVPRVPRVLVRRHPRNQVQNMAARDGGSGMVGKFEADMADDDENGGVRVSSAYY
ncbi:uncharacterized protein CTRU02_210263 [Colletotrichum truncatum]|uniref:Uncharacterized protein n=1 Tax=Colletotrichum truncatum TaxID=5467 RepID=A0ACC3YXS5_COLTU|nr:uncharacterized protein CTRU02_11473 [Colletotrichum truncatum]KAF6785848.1 hypothetical protein CTRU02_11473 [Colletotrichum truncatum]